MMSRTVWEWVMPWLVPRSLLVTPATPFTRVDSRDAVVTTMRVGEAMFPLVGRVCRSLLRHYDRYYRLIEAAAEAAPCYTTPTASTGTGGGLCVNWLLANYRKETSPEAGPGEMTVEMRMKRRVAKEFVHVLAGLCRAGNLATAQWLVDGNWPGLVWCGTTSAATTTTMTTTTATTMTTEEEAWGGRCGGELEGGRLADHVREFPILKRACKKGHLDVARWLVERFGFREPWEFFAPLHSAVSGGHLELAQWMVNTFDLASQFRRYSRMKIQLRSCKSENLGVVKWCFETFPENPSTLATLVGCLGGTGSDSVKICEYVLPLLKLRQPPGYSALNEINRVDENLSKFCNKEYTAPVLLIEKFHISEPKRSVLLCRILAESIQGARFSQVKKVASKGEFTKESVAECLPNNVGVESTKAVKWLIRHFQLEREHITAHDNLLLSKMIYWGQENCAEWLIHKFHITLDEVLSLDWRKSQLDFDLGTWKMMLRCFPSITAAIIKEKLLGLVLQSPIIASFTMRHFPDITMDDIYEFAWSVHLPSDSDTTCCWLYTHDLNLQHRHFH
ncbi:hypothetical protein Pelo_6494 [Pelomyxa schiedti]|nr:hypothetical protein Pelo_6494 [Pelomyxa schiedti]